MDDFNKYMEYFKGLTLKQKQEIIVDELKLLTAMTNKMCKEIDANNEVILSKELADLNKENYTEDNFSEAVITYICSIKNSLADFSIKLTNISENLE